MAYTMYTPLNVWLDPASVTDVVAYIQNYLSENTIYSEEEIETLIHDYLIAHPELIGGVQSVNGKTGTVVLTASDINTTNNTTIQAVINSLSADIASIVQSVTTLSGRVTSNETGITNEATARANADTALGNRITALQGAVGSPLVAVTASAMTDTSKIYVYTGSESGYTNGNWYYYNGSTWTSGGVYNATAINTDTTLTVAGMAADAKATGDGLNDLKSNIQSIKDLKSFNLLDGVEWEIGTIDASTGNPQAANNRVRTVDYIDLIGIKTITLSIASGYKFVYDTYNSNKVLSQMAGGGVWNTGEKTLEISGNVRYLKLLVCDTSNGVADVSYGGKLSGEYTTSFNKLAETVEEFADIKDGIDSLGILPWNDEIVTGSTGNHYIYHNFIAGKRYTFKLTFAGTTSDSGQKNVQIYDDSSSRLAIYYGNQNINLVFPSDSEYLRFVVSRTGTWTDFSVTVSMSEDAQSHIPYSYTVEKDGSGDFTSLVSAITEAVKHKNSIVYVGAGTWDILTELGTAYLNAISESDKNTWGIILKNGIHLIFSTQAEVIANYTGNSDNVKKYLSVFNAGEGGFTLENCRIRSSNIRYCVHDDPGISTPYQNKYINCDMYHDNSGNTVFGGWQCIGGGFGYNSEIIVDGCVFDGHNQYSDIGGILSYHNSSLANAMSKLVVKNCYFKGAFTVRVSWLGTSTKITNAYITSCRLGAAPTKTAENTSATVENVDIIAWNNDIAS